MFEKKKEELVKEMEDVKALMAHLEDEYRKANISEKYYQEMREKYAKKLEELEKKIGEKKSVLGIVKKEGKKSEKDKSKKEVEVGEIEEMTPEVIEKLAAQVAQESGVEVSTQVEEKEEEKSETTSIEIEKLKVLIETVREANKALEESLRNLSESIGELRSMVFQTEGSTKEMGLKLEKIEDEISQVKPKEIEKKFNELNSKIEKQQLAIEKLEVMSKDLGKKINEIHKMLKSIGGIENLINVNEEIQKKIKEIKEVFNYIERLALKTEKVFVDLSKSLNEFIVYKTRQESLEELSKDILKSIDEINVKLDGFSTKKDLEMIKGDLLVLQKQVEEINSALGAIRTRIPEPIEQLKKEKESIEFFLSSLEEQLKDGRISLGEYEKIRKNNLERIKEIEDELREKWEKIIEAISKGEEIKFEEREKREGEREEKEEEVVKNEKNLREEMVDVLKRIKERVK